MKSRRSLTVYCIRERISGIPVTDFDHAIADRFLDDPNLTTHELEGEYNFEAKLFVLMPPPREPAWAEFLREGFEDVEVGKTVANRAVLVARIFYYEKHRYFAFTFGAGRYLLKPNSYTRRYGLRAALNVIYQGDEPDALTAPARIRRVDAKTVSANTLHTRRQTNRLASFDIFGVDVQGDLLGTVTGKPMEGEWGSRITGADALYLNVETQFANLGDLCKRIWSTEELEDDYKVRFGWVDDIKFVEELGLLGRLEALILDALKSRQTDKLALAPPELVDWDTLSEFRFTFASGERYHELDLTDFIAGLERHKKLDNLTVDKLKKTNRAEALDDEGGLAYSWPAWRCLSGEVVEGGKTYVLDAGDFYEVAPGYLKELDGYIEHLKECDVDLPSAPMTPDGKELTEGKYNEQAADYSPNYLLLDKQTVRVDTHTSPIEICDIWTADRRFIHVKRKLQSSSLSHLFAQGSVSADLFLMSEEYRQQVRAKVEKLSAEVEDAQSREQFSDLIPREVPDSSQYEVVYAIIAKWMKDNRDRSLVDALPFFSKVNLRRHTDSLRRMGYRVSYKKIEVTDAPEASEDDN